jgi:hypothetical protein
VVGRPRSRGKPRYSLPHRFKFKEAFGNLLPVEGAKWRDSSPNVMKTDRPEWLAPFNFFLFPLLSDLGGYPPGFDRSSFRFITPPGTNRNRWKNLEGINLLDGRIMR